MLLKQIRRFIFFGILNTVFYYVVYSFFLYLNFNYKIAVLFATILGILFNFKTFGKFVFDTHDNKLIYRFILSYGMLLLINLGFIKFFYILGYNYYLSGMFAIAPYAIFSFIFNRYYVFKKKNLEGIG
jgi:putative flippase GtrA